MASSSWIFYFVMLFAKNSLPFSLFQPRKSSIIKQGRMTIYISNSDLVEKYTINKTESHHKLLEISNKHIRNFDQYKNSNVFAQHTVNAFNEARDFVDEFYSSNQIRRNTIKKVILDSGCGVGFSTLQLARKFPQYPVIGIDRSIHRLEKNIAYPIVQHDNTTPSSVKDNNLNSASQQNLDNVLLIRAELSDFWMLAAEQSNWIVESHYILYPNPYPKNKHVMRRWHGIIFRLFLQSSLFVTIIYPYCPSAPMFSCTVSVRRSPCSAQ
jgi:tRNA G46 methylase TrmB